jgi:branched-chain amino acid transport system permease protein
MAALGYNVQVHRFVVLVISGFFPGVAGVLGVFYYGGVSPATTGLSQIMLVVMAAIAGGVSSIEGGIVGAFIAVLLTSIAGQYTQHYTTIIGLVFVLLILFLPGGVLGSREQLERLAGRLRFRGPGRGSVTTPGAKPANAVNATGTFRRWKHRE